MAENVRIQSFEKLPTPNKLRADIPMTDAARGFVARSRETVARILRKQDPRRLVIVGPCSIHNMRSALQYAHKLKEFAKTVRDQLFLVMRVYLQKPRTTVGWTGFLDDPGLDGSFRAAEGIVMSRRLMRDITSIGVPIATEMLGTTLEPQYLCEFVTWTCIGARTTESQVHRHLASGLSMPVGFKNASDGDAQKAVDACVCASNPRAFIGIDADGSPSVVRTTGNPNVGVVLRGSYKNGPNDHLAARVDELMADNGLQMGTIVDCAHGNSGKTLQGQLDTVKRLCESRHVVRGIMLESFLRGGNQRASATSTPDVSVTDPCLSWDRTQLVCKMFAETKKTK